MNRWQKSLTPTEWTTSGGTPPTLVLAGSGRYRGNGHTEKTTAPSKNFVAGAIRRDRSTIPLRPASELELTKAEIATLEDPDRVTEDEADVIDCKCAKASQEVIPLEKILSEIGERNGKSRRRKGAARPTAELNLTKEEIAMLPDPNWITEDDADAIMSLRSESEGGAISLEDVKKEIRAGRLTR